MSKTRKFSPEVRERAVRLFQEQRPEHPSQWAALCSIAAKIGCTAETLRRWVHQSEKDEGVRDGVSTDERQRLKNWSGKIVNSNEPTRSSAKPLRISSRRSSTADPNDGGFH